MITQSLLSSVRTCFKSTYLFMIISVAGINTVQAEELTITDVVVFAHNSILLEGNVNIISGSIVVNEASSESTLVTGFELGLEKNVTVSGAALIADSIQIGKDSIIDNDVFYNELSNKGIINGEEFAPLDLPIFDKLPPFETISNEEGQAELEDMHVSSLFSLELPPGDYGRVEVDLRGEIFFTGGVYNIQELDIGYNTSVTFGTASRIHVADKLRIGRNSDVGPAAGSGISARDIVFYVAGVNGTDGNLESSPVATKLGKGTSIHANFYVPNGTLRVNQNSNIVGAFLAKDVEIKNNVQLSLDSFFVNLTPIAADDNITVEQGETATILDSGEASILANDSDPEDGILTVTTTPVTAPLHGSLILQEDGAFSYTHDGSDELSDSFVYEVCDDATEALCTTATVTIVIIEPTIELSLTFLGTGYGQVQSTPAGLDCVSDCTATISSAQVISLIGNADPGSMFVSWGGDTDCEDGSLNPDGHKDCTVTFDLTSPPTETIDIAVQLDGLGGGTVISDPAGIDCPGNCLASFSEGARITLFPTADENSLFTAWTGDTDCNDGTLIGDVDANCTANFDVAPPPEPSFQLTLTVSGEGGAVSTDPRGISCATGSTCMEDFPIGSEVRFLLRPDSSSTSFFIWSGDADCADGQVTMDADKTCALLFSNVAPLETIDVTIQLAGTGSGFVSSSPTGVDCPTDCTETYPQFSQIVLAAIADEGSVFVGWSGDADCTDGVLSGLKDLTCIATFEPQAPTSVSLTIEIVGNPVGEVDVYPTSSFEFIPPGGIFQFRGSTCNEQDTSCEYGYPRHTSIDPSATLGVGTEVILTPSFLPPVAFISWGGDADCADGIVTMDASKTCIAEFGSDSVNTKNITILFAGEGGGTVTSVPAGLNCAVDCSIAFPEFDLITLTSTADAGSVFAGWRGDSACSEGSLGGTEDRTCIAKFDLINPSPSFELTVNVTGVGGTVSSSPIGLVCNTGSTCTEDFPVGTTVTLAALPDSPDFTFNGWSGDADCADGVVTIDADKTCNAEFVAETIVVSVIFDGLGASAGTVTSVPAGIDCPLLACEASFPKNTQITLTAVPITGVAFDGWSSPEEDGDEPTPPGCENGIVDGSVDQTCIATYSPE